jgi:hypothetical protein
MAPPAHRDPRVTKATREFKECRGKKVIKEMLGQSVQQAFKVRRVIKEFKA